MTSGRSHAQTRLSLAPLSVDEALAAMLKTPPPTEKKAPKKRIQKGARG
jgi:hypothetical protein